jgi:hypothetical protein
MNLDIPEQPRDDRTRRSQFLAATALPLCEDDDNVADEASDSIAAQVWKMYNKQRKDLPNGARMENLTWRMVCSTHRRTPAKMSDRSCVGYLVI